MKTYERFEVTTTPCTVPTYAGFAYGTEATPAVTFERVQFWASSRMADRVVGMDSPFYLVSWGMVSTVEGVLLAENETGFIGYFDADIETDNILMLVSDYHRLQDMIALKEQAAEEAKSKKKA